MFIVNLHYTATLEEVDKHMAAHVKFLNIWYKKNIFMMSGRKVPRTGGVILARASSMEELGKIMDQDPFCKFGVAEVTITEFMSSQIHPALKAALAGF